MKTAKKKGLAESNVMAEEEVSYSELKKTLGEKSIKKVKTSVENLNYQFESLLRTEINSSNDADRRVISVDIIVEEGYVKKLIFNNSFSIMKADGQFKKFFIEAITTLPDEKLRRLYDILKDSEEKIFVFQCILIRRRLAYKVLNIFNGVEQEWAKDTEYNLKER